MSKRNKVRKKKIRKKQRRNEKQKQIKVISYVLYLSCMYAVLC